MSLLFTEVTKPSFMAAMFPDVLSEIGKHERNLNSETKMTEKTKTEWWHFIVPCSDIEVFVLMVLLQFHDSL